MSCGWVQIMFVLFVLCNFVHTLQWCGTHCPPSFWKASLAIFLPSFFYFVSKKYWILVGLYVTNEIIVQLYFSFWDFISFPCKICPRVLSGWNLKLDQCQGEATGICRTLSHGILITRLHFQESCYSCFTDSAPYLLLSPVRCIPIRCLQDHFQR